MINDGRSVNCSYVLSAKRTEFVLYCAFLILVEPIKSVHSRFWTAQLIFVGIVYYRPMEISELHSAGRLDRIQLLGPRLLDDFVSLRMTVFDALHQYM